MLRSWNSSKMTRAVPSRAGSAGNAGSGCPRSRPRFASGPTVSYQNGWNSRSLPRPLTEQVRHPSCRRGCGDPPGSSITIRPCVMMSSKARGTRVVLPAPGRMQNDRGMLLHGLLELREDGIDGREVMVCWNDRTAEAPFLGSLFEERS